MNKKATFETGKTYTGIKNSDHYFRASFEVVKLTADSVTVRLVGTKETFTKELKKNIEGQFCKIEKIIISSSREQA